MSTCTETFCQVFFANKSSTVYKSFVSVDRNHLLIIAWPEQKDVETAVILHAFARTSSTPAN